MNGVPYDVEGQCNAHLYIADDYGDNTATIRCQCPQGHEFTHRHTFNRGTPTQAAWVRIEWHLDERDWEKYVKIDENGATYHCTICGEYKKDRLSRYYLSANNEEKICCQACYDSKCDDDTMKLKEAPTP